MQSKKCSTEFRCIGTLMTPAEQFVEKNFPIELVPQQTL